MNVTITQFQLKNTLDNCFFSLIGATETEYDYFLSFLIEHYKLDNRNREEEFKNFKYDSLKFKKSFNSIINDVDLNKKKAISLIKWANNNHEVFFDNNTLNIDIDIVNYLDELKVFSRDFYGFIKSFPSLSVYKIEFDSFKDFCSKESDISNSYTIFHNEEERKQRRSYVTNKRGIMY